MTMILRSERLTFRPFQYSDAERLAVLVNDIEIARWIGPMPHPYTLEMANEYLHLVIRSKESTFALERNNQLVGAIGIRKMLGFWLARDHWGLGLMTEAATALISDHFVRTGTPILSGFHVGNVASARVHEKLGFEETGVSTCYSQALGKEVERRDLILTATEWRAPQ